MIKLTMEVSTDSLTQIACDNGFCWHSVSQTTDVYIAYRKISTQQTGWIKLSFDINWAWPITAPVNEAIVICSEAGRENNPSQPAFTQPQVYGKANNKLIISPVQKNQVYSIIIFPDLISPSLLSNLN